MPAPVSDEPTTPSAPLPVIPFFEAFKFWLKLGFISFGGPAGQIAIMHRELVEERRWISEKRFLHALNFCMLLPGPEGQQLTTYLGWLMHRTWGGVVAGMLFVLPSLFILVGLSWIYVDFGGVPWVAGLLCGVKPAVAALSFVAIAVLSVPFPWVVLAAALMGWRPRPCTRFILAGVGLTWLG